MRQAHIYTPVYTPGAYINAYADKLHLSAPLVVQYGRSVLSDSAIYTPDPA
jgi:hypothetical protein